ncbi:hypothetical protein [Evansella tamaricis]|uniref:Uncharacterized protein n=1 Tax=Evansella tamaricis TaxID=2069301 RepID=A0ABS6JBQ4_9BACI|nr:hypothetical protein [Evansella tamaricis]MBU9711106.1 hypothetical protein [Evansella tamaricis]
MDDYFCPDCEQGFAVDEDVEPKGCPHCLEEVYEFSDILEVKPYIPKEGGTRVDSEDIRNRINALKSRLQQAEYIVTDTLADLEVLEREVEKEENEKSEQMVV